MKTFLLLSSLSIFFWLGWRAHLCWWLNGVGRFGHGVLGHRHRGVRVPFDSRLWQERMSAPALAMLVWSLFAFAAAALGWI